MLMNPLFVDVTLNNRLGQQIHLHVCHIHQQGRSCVFVASPSQQASSLVAKNAEPFAFQLRERFGLIAGRFDLIEIREASGVQHLYRWRFEWAGNSPLSARAEEVTSAGQINMLFSLLAEPAGALLATA